MHYVGQYRRLGVDNKLIAFSIVYLSHLRQLWLRCVWYCP
jgi:hypothetical protein